MSNNNPKKFALIGLAGFIAGKHLKAIRDTENLLIAALDKHDSVGIADSYFPNCDFFTEYERFDRHLYKLRRKDKKIDFVSICTPNYLHDSHIRFALRNDADAICEKPLVLNPWNIDPLVEIENETNRKVFNVLQLRLHPAILELKKMVEKTKQEKKFDIDLTYITSRGKWYYISWKGDISKSGGIATNIGIHFFDMLAWIFGDVLNNKVHILEPNKAAGYLELKNARVKWFLSIDYEDIPEKNKLEGKRTYRSITIDNQELEFSKGFEELHTKTYENILTGNGFGISDARKSIEIVHEIRNSTPIGLKGEYHKFCKN